ncbi:Cerato-ulmin hydrophobin family [Xylaria longipes]|nr:Cerato-ulmin hydrophobin family [Xylaria longipes]
MRYSILFTTVLATAVAAGPIDLLNVDALNGGYPVSSSTSPNGGYPTSSTSTPAGGYPTSSTTKPGHSSSTTTPGGGHSTTTSTPGGGHSTTTTPGGGHSTTTSTPGGGHSTTTTTPGGGHSTTSSTTSTGTPYPTGGNGGYDACPDGLFSVEQCCATDILGVADLDCHSPAAVPSSPSSFQSICAAGGQRARCCVIPVLGQAVLCITPVGI